MYKRITISIIAVMIFIACGSYLTANTPSHPLRKSEILALVAGGIFPEDIIHDLESRGIAFAFDDNFRSLLQTASADGRVINALQKVTPVTLAKPETMFDQALLQHLSYAGSLIHSGKTQEAANELKNYLSTGAGKSEIGFVMGEILIVDRRFAEAGQVYAEILNSDPDFPELHQRLSLAYAESDDTEKAFREAKAALKQNPNDAVAHRSAGIALRDMQNFDASKLEFQESIRSKPDYDLAYGSLGILLDSLQDFAGAATQFKKALTLNPGNLNAQYNLGNAYASEGNYIAAIREYRDVKRRDPKRLDARQNLGSALMHTDSAAAITEFRELVALAPDFPICHQCLANALYNVGRLSEAKTEYQTVMASDPANPVPHRGLGLILEFQKEYDAALVEYRKSEALDDSSGLAFGFAGRVLLLKKDFAAAITELKRAEERDPSKWEHHAHHGEALEGLGDRDAAIVEYKESLSLAPKRARTAPESRSRTGEEGRLGSGVKQLSSSCARRRAAQDWCCSDPLRCTEQIPVRAAALPAASCRSAFFR